jgi:IS30 family transposase
LAVHLTKEQREIAFRLRKKGLSLKVIAKALGCAHPTILRVQRLKYEARSLPWMPAQGRLSIDEREEMNSAGKAGDHFISKTVLSLVTRGIGGL